MKNATRDLEPNKQTKRKGFEIATWDQEPEKQRKTEEKDIENATCDLEPEKQRETKEQAQTLRMQPVIWRPKSKEK